MQTEQGSQTIKVPIGCPGLHCNTELLTPLKKLGAVLAQNGRPSLVVGNIDDQNELGVSVSEVNLALSADDTKWDGGHLRVTNGASKELVTAVVKFRVTSAQGEELDFSTIVDNFLVSRHIAPGGSIELNPGTTGNFGGHRIDSVNATVPYVEFSDGSYGGSEADEIHKQMLVPRQQAIEFARSIVSGFPTRPQPDDVLVGLLAEKSTDNAGTRTAKMNFRAIASTADLNSAWAEMERLSQKSGLPMQ